MLTIEQALQESIEIFDALIRTGEDKRATLESSGLTHFICYKNMCPLCQYVVQEAGIGEGEYLHNKECEEYCPAANELALCDSRKGSVYEKWVDAFYRNESKTIKIKRAIEVRKALAAAQSRVLEEVS